MAQPVLSQLDPLSTYLIETGEDVRPYDDAPVNVMPGHLEGVEPSHPARRHVVLQWGSRVIGPILDMILSYVSSPAHRMTEQFKFIIITSSLLSSELSSNLAAPFSLESPRSAFSFDGAPGKFRKDKQAEGERDGEEGTLWLWACVGVPLAAFSGSSWLLVACMVLWLVWSIAHAEGDEAGSATDRHEDVFPTVVDSLEVLVDVARSWDSCVAEAMSLLEEEESSLSCNPSASSPTTPLRAVLREALHDTGSRSDTVRSLLSPLTSSASIRLLGEMFAPAHGPQASPEPSHASPTPTRKTPHFHSSSAVRPLSASASMSSFPLHSARKTARRTRMSLSGITNDDLYIARSRSRNLNNELFHESLAESSTTASALSTPPRPPISRARSDGQMRQSVSSQPAVPFPEVPASPHNTQSPLHDPTTPELHSAFSPRQTPEFHPAFSQRRRSTSTTSTPSTPLMMPRHTTRSSRKATLVQRRRNPLALPALNSDLHAALESRRWAAAHLLALRFEEEQGESAANRGAYWEDVRAVVQLWGSSLSEVIGGLRHALAEVHAKLEEAAKQPAPPFFPRADVGAGVGTNLNFAPAPTPMARFLDRTDTIAATLDEIRAQLAASTAALRSWSLDPQCAEPLQAYEVARQLFATALREYEHGRADLVAVLDKKRDLAAAEEDEPALVQDNSSSAEGSEMPVSPIEPSSPLTLRIFESVLRTQYQDQQQENEEEEDDATAHLLLTASARHLADQPAGIEQVFEADSGALGYTRERSKLSREERIQLAKAKRLSLAASPSSPKVGEGGPARMKGVERWGPGGEVVQELKDVIQKVGQRRLALVERRKVVHPVTPPTSPPTRTLDHAE